MPWIEKQADSSVSNDAEPTEPQAADGLETPDLDGLPTKAAYRLDVIPTVMEDEGLFARVRISVRGRDAGAVAAPRVQIRLLSVVDRMASAQISGGLCASGSTRRTLRGVKVRADQILRLSAFA